ncbi:hypothetical protein NL676_039157 [Syzygium grande]|nr:hypothetical protein NL676_039157 [Syzygium grande]
MGRQVTSFVIGVVGQGRASSEASWHGHMGLGAEAEAEARPSLPEAARTLGEETNLARRARGRRKRPRKNSCRFELCPVLAPRERGPEELAPLARTTVDGDLVAIAGDDRGIKEGQAGAIVSGDRERKWG